MKYIDINKRFTEIVSEYIATGYTMNTATMTGSQGEIASIDLTNGNEILRVLVRRFDDCESLCSLTGVEIAVGRVPEEDRVTPHDDSGWHTIWNNHLEVLRQERFYQVGESRRSGKFYGNLEEAEAAGALRLSRYRAKHSDENKPLPAQAIEVAKRVIRERLGVKRICKDDVKISRGERGGYTVSYRNSACRIN